MDSTVVVGKTVAVGNIVVVGNFVAVDNIVVGDSSVYIIGICWLIVLIFGYMVRCWSNIFSVGSVPAGGSH